jgi:CRP-like cAMP-binding protein
VESSSLAVEQRYARQLVDLYTDGLADQSAEGIVLRFSQLDIAKLIGASRDSVVPVIRALKKRSILETGRQKIIILDLDALRSIARGEQTASG